MTGGEKRTGWETGAEKVTSSHEDWVPVRVFL